MHIWLALRFSFFKLEAQGVELEKDACVVASSRKKVCIATPLCLKEGVKVGMPISTAQALMNCKVLIRDKDKEHRLLQTVCDVLYAFTPYIQSYYPNDRDETCDQGLLLELSRCTQLFDGVDRLVNKILAALDECGLMFKWALSKSSKAAWLLSFEQKSNELKNSVLHIKTRDLDEFPEEASSLEAMGFLCLEDIQKHIEVEGIFSLQKRFDVALVQYLLDILSADLKEEVVNKVLEPVESVSQKDLFSESSPNYRSAMPSVIYEPEAHYHDSLIFDFPLSSLELLYEPMQQLLKRFSDYLVTKQKQCSGIQWRFGDIYHNYEVLDVRCELMYRDWQLLYELSVIKLEQKGLPFEVDQLELINPVLIDAVLNTSELVITKPQGVSDIRVQQRVITKIQARLGEENVFKVSCKNDHFPECSQNKVPVDKPALKIIESETQHAIRPSWILNTPVKVGKNQNDLYWNGRIELIRGPERLEGHWWDKPTARDYFVAVREDQVRLWVFNDLFREEWFVQGVF